MGGWVTSGTARRSLRKSPERSGYIEKLIVGDQGGDKKTDSSVGDAFAKHVREEILTVSV